jgi:TPR repeat protein
MYLEGTGVRRDYFVAMDWFFRAAAQGDADAEYNLGIMYAYGIGVARQDAKARRWLSRAASRRHRLAERELDGIRQRGAEFRRRYPLPDLRRVKRNLYG